MKRMHTNSNPSAASFPQGAAVEYAVCANCGQMRIGGGALPLLLAGRRNGMGESNPGA